LWGTRKRELGTTEIEELDYSREHERVSPWSEVRGIATRNGPGDRG
jgi:hypothetical protein